MKSVTDPSRIFLPPLSSPSSGKPAFSDFNIYVYTLFKAALEENKKLSLDLLKDPTFGNRIVKNLPKGSLSTPRIVVLNILAHNALGTFPKQDLADLISAVGQSNYVASCSNADIQALYKKLFSFLQSGSFSQTDLLDFEHHTIPSLQSYIFRRLLNHPSFAGSSIITINDLARRYLGYLPKPHIQHLVYKIDKSDSDTETKVNSLKWSLFSYPESQYFSKEDLMRLVENMSQELRPYVLIWALEHPAFLDASLKELEHLTEKLEETICPGDVRIKFLSSLLKHPSLPFLAINR